uniref:Uncharacterized protein n=1 Tax=Alexandrium catenella TaxID=2925 RepID=A0A7S1S857_ALECA
MAQVFEGGIVVPAPSVAHPSWPRRPLLVAPSPDSGQEAARMITRRLGVAARRCSAACAGRWLGGTERGFHVMKNSWPTLRQPHDPSKPSVSRVIRQMDSNKNAREAPAPNRRTHARHLPDGVFPAAAATPGAISGPGRRRPEAGASQLPRSPGGVPPASWRPPGWESIAAQRGVPGAVRGPKRKKDTLGEDRPAFETWGMRIIGVMLVGVAYVELRRFSWGPTGITRKPRGRVTYEPEQQ